MIRLGLTFLIFFNFFIVVVYSQTNILADLDEIQKLGMNDSSLALNKIKKIRLKLNDSLRMAYSYKVEGVIYYVWGNTKKALIANKIAEKKYLLIKSNEGKASLYNNLAIIYYDLNKDELAVKYYQKAINTAKIVDDLKILSIASANLSNIYIKLNIPINALFHAKKALEYSKKYQVNDQIFNAFNMLGTSFNLMNQVDKAQLYFLKANELANNLRDSIKIAMSLGNISNCFLKKKNYDSSIFYIQKTIAISEKINYMESLSQMYNSKGIIYFTKNNFKEAIINYEKALKFSNEKEITENKLFNYNNLALAYSKIKNFEKAYQYQFLLTELSDSLKAIENTKKIIESEEKFKVKEKNLKIQDLKKQQIILAQKSKAKVLWMSLVVLILLLLILSLILVLNRFRNKSKNKIIQQEKKRLEIEYRLLRSQMNPHFLFNTLHAIHQYIQENKNDDASNMLLKFSVLIRNILQQSTKDFIPILDDLKQLKNYLEIEKLRFKSKFVYEIDVDKSLDLDEIYIPTLIIQPFVENAVIHGVGSLIDKQGIINIHIKRFDDQVLQVEIIDNGLGFNPSKDKNKHESLAIKITNDRLSLLIDKSKYNNKLISYVSSQNGTNVIVLIPYKFEF